MAKGNKIIVNAHPMGRRLEGPIKTGETPKPGTVMQIDVSAGLNDYAQFTYEAFNADGDGTRPIGPLFVLLEDELQGRTATTAYAAGENAFVYVPLPGDELNMLVLNIAGTADDHAIGEMLIVDDTTGKLIATTGTPETEPFMLLETITDPTADTLAHCIYTGH